VYQSLAPVRVQGIVNPTSGSFMHLLHGDEHLAMCRAEMGCQDHNLSYSWPSASVSSVLTDCICTEDVQTFFPVIIPDQYILTTIYLALTSYQVS
jgi:hypothetical protein